MFPSIFEENSPEYHVIRIEHPLLNYYGISAMTTGQLVSWWNQQNYRKEFMNRNFLYLKNGNPYATNRIGEFLNSYDPVEDDNENYTFKTWRKQGYNGKDVYYYAPSLKDGTDLHTRWALYEGGGYGAATSITDNFCGESAGTSDELAGATIKFEYEDLYFNPTPLCDNNTQLGVSPPYAVDGSGQFPFWLYSLINSHNTVIKAYSIYGPDTSLWPECMQARKALSDDIMIGGGLVWSGVLGFNIKIDNIICQKFESVKYTLQLLDATELKKKNDNFAAMKKIFLSSPAPDPFGRKITNSRNGDYTSVTNEEDISQHKVGELSVTWNPVERKYESGTLQIPAILATDIQASNARDADFLDSVAIEELLNDPTSSNYLNMPTGLAIPLVSANGNPSTIAPTYDKEESCRDNNEKLKIIVYNPFPRSFKKDANVILSKINGVWIPMDVGQEQQELTNEFLGKWEFAYFMTNMEYYFTDAQQIDGVFNRFSYENYELSVRNTLYTNDFEAGENSQIKQRNANQLSKVIYPNPWGYWQITSWDLMGTQMGGKRIGGNGNPGNAIAGTVVGFDLTDNVVENNSQLTNPFFGCVFPDGYDVDEVKAKYDKYTSTDVSITRIPESNSSLLTEIENSTNIFDDSYNVNIETTPYNPNGSNSGVFSGLSKGIYTLRHLPADIALNSSRCVPFGSQNGAPLKEYSLLSQYLSANIGWRKVNSEELFKNQADLSHCFIETKQSDTEVDQPVWNLKPNVPNRIQFRPMKIELYASAEYAILDMAEYTRRFNLPKVTTMPPGRNTGSPSPPTSWDCNYLKSLNGGYCGPNDPRLNHSKPDLLSKSLGGCQWASFASMGRSRGKFAARAALMVKDFYDTNYAILDKFKNHIGLGLSPIWGADTDIAGRNFIDVGDYIENYSLLSGSRGNPVHNAGDELGDFSPERTFYAVINNDVNSENPFAIQPNVVTPCYIESDTCPTYVLQGGYAKNYQTIYGGTAVLQSPVQAGLAYGHWDYSWKGKRFALQHTSLDDGAWPRIDLVQTNFNNLGNYGGSSSLGAIGVIGAICTMKVANPKGITLKTDYLYGHATQSVNGSLRPSYRDLPGTNGLYRSNTTGLYARIFQYWPRHLTIYDPRFFAVHHFNDGAGIRSNDIGKLCYLDNVLIKDPSQSQISQAEAGVYPKDFSYSRADSSVDLRSPTFYDGTFCDQGLVFYDSVDRTSYKPLRSRQHWNIRTDNAGMSFSDGRNRRGRLLPYKYDKKIVSIAALNNSDAIFYYTNNPTVKVKDLTDTSGRASILVINNGKNYQVGDTLTVTTGSSVILTVTSVAGKTPPAGMEEGAILSMTVTNAGDDFDGSNFMKLDTFLNQSATSATRVVNASVKSGGSGFVGYVINGVIRDLEYEDKKPKQIGGLVKLTNPVNNYDDVKISGPISSNFETSVFIPDSDKSSNNLYDIFLHFHNDASHVHGHKWGLTKNPDQYINLELN